MDGFSAKQLFQSRTGYAYDDIIVLPGFINFPVSEVNLNSHLTKNIKLQTPIVSLPYGYGNRT